MSTGTSALPQAVDVFTTQLDGVNVDAAANINHLQDAVSALETYAGVGPVHYSVKGAAFAATGSGTGDDSAAINGAIAAALANGGKVVFPAGTYRITSKITAAVGSQQLILEGQGGATISAAYADPGAEDGAISITGTSSGSLVMRNLSVVRSPLGTTTGTLDGILIQAATSGQAGLKGVVLDNVQVSGFTLWGISIVNATGVLVGGCQSSNNKNGGLEFVGGGGVAVIGGVYNNNVSSTGGSDYGIAFASSSTYGATSGALVAGVQANSNGRKGIDAHHCIGLKVIGNTCIGNGTNASGSTPSGIYAVNEDSTKTVRDVLIEGNLVDMAGVAVAGAYGIAIGAAGATTTDSGTFIVRNNIVRNCDGHATDQAVYVYTPTTGGIATDKIIIENNTLEKAAGTSQSAILTGGTAVQPNHVICRGNIIHIAGAASGGITLQACNDIICVHNTLQFDGATTNGIFANNGKVLVKDNILLGTAPTNAVNITGSAWYLVKDNLLNTQLVAEQSNPPTAAAGAGVTTFSVGANSSMRRGSISVTVGGGALAAGAVVGTVTFPGNGFTTAPFIVLTPETISSYYFAVATKSATSFQIVTQNGMAGGASIVIDFVAL